MNSSDTRQIALDLRRLVIRMLSHAGSGHTAGSLGMADVFAVLYFSDLLQLPPPTENSRNTSSLTIWPRPDDRGPSTHDRIILSNGHICPIWYAALAKKGYFPLDDLFTLRQFGSPLQGHPHIDFQTNSSPHNLPGVENTSGPLGQGIGFAVGLALGLRHQFETKQLSRLPRVICLCGDGELDEGQCWEAFMTAAKYKLTHLTFIIDRNDIQIDGFTHDVMPLHPLKDKLQSFGLCPLDINAHNHADIYNSIQLVASSPRASSPFAVIAHTTPGKGVSFMENQPAWHGKVPTHEETEQALKELC